MVEGGRLEIVLAVMSRYVGSNPTFSAIFRTLILTDCRSKFFDRKCEETTGIRLFPRIFS